MGWTLLVITVNDRRLRHLHPRVEQPDQAQRQQQDGHHRRSTQPAGPPSSPRLDREIPCARSAAAALPTSKFRRRRVPILWICRRRPPYLQASPPFEPAASTSPQPLSSSIAMSGGMAQSISLVAATGVEAGGRGGALAVMEVVAGGRGGAPAVIEEAAGAGADERRRSPRRRRATTAGGHGEGGGRGRGRAPAVAEETPCAPSKWDELVRPILPDGFVPDLGEIFLYRGQPIPLAPQPNTSKNGFVPSHPILSHKPKTT
ncbi:hypothetical protein OsI_28836 [Oryza sativa Indica Group]|uniref:Uncharacterized protein n=1 Tax=Oryza sativa subsp. indica TaxID=39946 RepID=B8B9U0_ORYSI|nr:hypothetical protein OsI_28836 [Oryza sativa Indica Group]